MIDALDKDICSPRSNYNQSVLWAIPVWGSGAYFKESSVVFERIKTDAVQEPIANLLEMFFPDGFSIIRKNQRSLIYGVPDEIEIEFTHPSIGVIKADYRVMSEKWREIPFRIVVEKDIVPENGKTGSSLKSSGLTYHDLIGISVVFPKEPFVSVVDTDDGLKLVIDKKMHMPVAFDPSVVIDTENVTNMAGRTIKRLVRLSTGRIHYIYYNTTTVCKSAYSDDNGDTWTIQTIYTSPSAGYVDVSIAADSTDTVHAVIAMKDLSGNYGVVYYTKTPTGSWSAGTTVVNAYAARPYIHLDADCDASDRLHIVWRYWGSSYNETYYTNDTQYSWPETSLGSASQRVTSGTDTSYYCSVVVERNGDAHIAYSSGNSRYVLYRYRTYATSTLGGVVTINDAGGTGIVYCMNIMKNYNYSGDVYVATSKLVSGIYEIYYAKSSDSGASWGALTAITSGGANHRSYPVLGVDQEGNMYIIYSYGTGASAVDMKLLKFFDDTWINLGTVSSGGSNYMDPSCVHSHMGTNNVYKGMSVIYEIYATGNIYFNRDWVEWWVAPSPFSGINVERLGGFYSSGAE